MVVNDRGAERPDDSPRADGGEASQNRPGRPATTQPRQEPRRLSPALIATLVAIPIMVLTFFIVVAALKAPLPGPNEALQFGAMANLPGVALIGQGALADADAAPAHS